MVVVERGAGTPSTREQSALLAELADRAPLSFDASLGDLVNYRPRRDQPFHRWFKYREGYSPELVRRALHERTSDALVLDPFCGCGTTLLESRRAGLSTVGVDINPVATLVARAKTRSYAAEEIRDLRLRSIEIAGVQPESGIREPAPELRIIGQIFRPEVLTALLTSLAIIKAEPDLRLREFLLTGWLAILEEVSNVFKEGNGIKYRNRRRTPTGYETIPWGSTAAYRGDAWALVRGALQRQYAGMLEDLNELTGTAEGTVIDGTATSLSMLDSASVGTAVFSPPYCNNFNYMKIFKVELWMGGFVRSYQDFRRLSQTALRSHVEMSLDLPDSLGLPTPLLQIAEWIGQAELWHAKIPQSVLAYFFDMKLALGELYRVLEPGGSAWMVVGNSAYAGVLVPTDLLLAEIANDVGLSVEGVRVARHLTTSSQQRGKLAGLHDSLRESVVVMRKPSDTL